MGCYGKGKDGHTCIADGEHYDDFAQVVANVAKLSGFDGVMVVPFKLGDDGVLHMTASFANEPGFCSHELSDIRNIIIEEIQSIEIGKRKADEDEDTIGPTEGEA